MASALLKDVAKDVGLSLQTVSDVLNCGDTRYSEKTRARIKEAAERLGYRPNLMAQSMVRGRTKTIGVITPTLNTPVTVEKIGAICHKAAEKGYQTYLGIVEDNNCEELVRGMVGRKVDGLICVISSTCDLKLFHKLSAEGMPMAFSVVGASLGAKGLPSVQIDTANGVAQMVKHLVELGHRRIAFAAGRNNIVPGGRLDGYRKGLKDADIRYDREIVLLDRDAAQDEVHAFTKEMLALPRPPTAILYDNDEMALIGVQTLAELGLKAPDDISIAGYDDLFFAAHVRPALTTARQPREAFADAMMGLIEDQLNGKPVDGKAMLLLPELVVRQSTGPIKKIQC